MLKFDKIMQAIKSILAITLSIVVALSITSCQEKQTGFPTATFELRSSPTHTPKPGPIPTGVSETPTAAPLCFTPIDLTPIAFTPDNAMLAIRTASGVQIISLGRMKEENFIQAPKNIVSASLSPAGQTLAWSFEDHTIQLVQVSDGISENLSAHNP